MDTPPLFSVVVPTYGRPEFLHRAVDSILGQTLPDFEIVIVDDASPEPVEVPDDPRVRLVRRSENGGPAAARNTGLDMARGLYLAFCDDDDLFAPGRLEAAARGLARAPVSVCWIAYPEDLTPRGGRMLEGYVHDVICDGLTPSLGATAVRAESMLRFREDLHNAEDIDWWIRMSASRTVATEPEVGYLFRRHSGPRILTGTERRIRDHRRLLAIHADYFARHPAAAAFRWKRIGLMALKIGDNRQAREAFLTALSKRPRAADVAHLLSTFRAAHAGS